MDATPLLLLTAPGADYTGPVALRSAAAFVTKAVEPAGSSYHARWCAKFLSKPVKAKKARVEQSLDELEAEDAGAWLGACAPHAALAQSRLPPRFRVPQLSGGAWPRSST